MNKIFLRTFVVIVLGVTQFANAQFRNKNRMDRLESFDEQKFSWGFFLNTSVYDYHLVLDPRYGMYDDRNLVTTKSSVGFGAGLIGKMRLNDYFDVRLEPGMQFVQREVRFETQTNDLYSGGSLTNDPFTTIVLTENHKVREVRSTLIDIPAMIEVHGNRWYNSRPYFATGINYIVNLQSNAKNPNDNLQGVFRTTTHNFAWSAEMGIQLYFRRFKMTPGVRGTFFLNNEIVADNRGTAPYWTPAISTMQSSAFMFMLKFE